LRRLLNIFLSIIILILIFYAICPVYDFPHYSRFSGDKIYNPYSDIDSSQWRKANFHVHARTLFGVLNGRNNSPQKIYNTYKSLGYDIISISNYFNIDHFQPPASSLQLPAYEHGANFFKTHQLSLGANKVLFFDYPFYQSINQMQYVIELLKKRADLIALAHPSWQNAYTPGDLKKLGGYDCFEVLNHNKLSVALWDSVLSSGHPAYIIADDDAHDILNTHQVGRCCTFINSSSLERSHVINALKSGRAFGVDFNFPEDEPFEQKAIAIKSMPQVNSIRVINNVSQNPIHGTQNPEPTLIISLNQQVKSIDFIGQNGKLKKSVANVSSAQYNINSDDSYIRTEILFPSGAKYYLNPVFRYNGITPHNAIPQIDFTLTQIRRTIIIILILFLIALIFYKTLKFKSLKSS
jgi:hypothetical protein